MAITCTFQQIPKDYNSTRSAADSSAAYSCNIRDGCGVINPVLEIVDSMSFNPADYTHVYIPTFHRTYWITESKFINRKWVVTGQVDVLITYKNAILGSTQYVLRSSSEYDTLVTDNLVYRKCKTKFAYHYQATNFIDPANIGAGGSFVVGVVGKESSSGMVTYYVLTPYTMSELRNYMLSMSEDDSFADWETAGESDDSGSGSGGSGGSGGSTVVDEAAKITNGAVKALINPFQYIVSCVWFPFTVPASGGITTIKFGFWDSDISAAKLGNNFSTVASAVLLSVPTRDDDSNRPGDYVRYEPFTNLTLYCPPFESIPLSPADAGNTIGVKIIVDNITGVGVLKVYGGGSDVQAESRVLAQRSAQIGVSMQIAQITTDYIGTLGNVQGALKGAFALGSDIGNKIATLLGADQAAEPGILNGQCSTATIAGAAGGFAGLSLAGYAFLVLRYTDITDSDNINVGKPLCKLRTLSTLSGFCLCREGHVSTMGTPEEKQEIERLLTSGIFIDQEED